MIPNFAYICADGVHVIHQLTQAGRTLVAVLLSCKSEVLQPLIPPALDALRSCIGLLRRFSGRYVCGLRSGDLMEEFCRRKLCFFLLLVILPRFSPCSQVTQIPLEPTASPDGPINNSRPPWIRPVRKKAPSAPRSSNSGESPSQHSSPEAFSPSEFFAEMSGGPGSPPKVTSSYPAGPSSAGSATASPVQGLALQPQQYMNARNAAQPGATSYIDPSSGMPMDIMRPDPQMYMSPSEVMALFNDGGVDVSSLFSSEFIQAQHQQGASEDGATGRQGGFGAPFHKMKMNGMVATP